MAKWLNVVLLMVVSFDIENVLRLANQRADRLIF